MLQEGTLPPPLESVDNPPPGEVVRGELHLNAVAGHYPYEVNPHFARKVGQNLVAGVQFDPKESVGKGFGNLALHNYPRFLLVLVLLFLLSHQDLNNLREKEKSNLLAVVVYPIVVDALYLPIKVKELFGKVVQSSFGKLVQFEFHHP